MIKNCDFDEAATLVLLLFPSSTVLMIELVHIGRAMEIISILAEMDLQKVVGFTWRIQISIVYDWTIVSAAAAMIAASANEKQLQREMFD